MISEDKSKPISALHEILAWSAKRPSWQRDALRRIVVQESLDKSDIDELACLCRVAHASTSNDGPRHTCVPLNSTHLPSRPGAISSVSLCSLSKLTGVNRIPSTEELRFGDTPGLTIIFGDNGAGKSGYARVIKRACRTRGTAAVIRPDIFSNTKPQMASAEFRCRVGGTEQVIQWSDDGTSNSTLANIFAFDSATAQHYLNQDDNASFTPYGLDVLPKLIKICDTINRILQDEIGLIQLRIHGVAKTWTYEPSTNVGKMIQGLSHSTKPGDVEQLSGLSETQAQRLDELTTALKSDSAQVAKSTRASATRLREFSARLKAVASSLSDERLATLKRLQTESNDADVEAKSFAKKKFDKTFLAGTGNKMWRALWVAAEQYSKTDVYPGEAFPYTEDEAQCVLCQQTLTPSAVAKMKQFYAFVVNTSEKHAQNARRLFNEAAEPINTMLSVQGATSKVDADLLCTDEKRKAIDIYIRDADKRLKTVKDNITSGRWTKPVSLPASPTDTIDALIASLDKRAKIEESVNDSGVREKLVTECNGLKARRWLAQVKDDVLQQVDRYRSIHILQQCQRDTRTTGITEKNTSLAHTIVTKEFCQRFAREVKAVGLRTLSINLSDVARKKGETKFGLRLVQADGHKISDIASEGEQRCVALAAFLAELSQASHQSSLIFDDPVSSLDHWHREQIASRLAEESLVRQIIVFTHDAVFLHDLQNAVQIRNQKPTIRYVEWGDGAPGRCRDELPWDWTSAAHRFDKLLKEQRQIKCAWNTVPSADNVTAIRRVYSHLRATIERIVEKEALGDVVFRFRSYVNISNLRRVVGFSDKEYQEIQRLTQKCHDITDAHDPSVGKHATVPDPDELYQDILATKVLYDLIRKRSKAC